MHPADFKRRLLKQPLILDGAISTLALRTSPAGSAESLCLSDPQLIYGIHRSYVDAGADILTTNSFAATDASVLKASVEIARRAAAGRNGLLVAGSIGPLHPETPEDVMVKTYASCILALIESGADLLLLETATNLRAIRAALTASAEIADRIGRHTAIMLSLCPGSKPGHLLSGESYNQLTSALNHFDSIASIGINCSNGLVALEENITALQLATGLPLSVHPNAGFPRPALTPEAFAIGLKDMLSRYPSIRIAGGCCGTTPAHIAALRRAFPRED